MTTVAGNAPIERTTRNALVILDLLGIDVPVHRGRPAAAGRARHAGYVHGESGLDGADLPEPDAAGRRRRRGRLHRRDRAAPDEGVWLVPTGPLTNIALALRAGARPRLTHRRHLADGRRATFGNRTAVGRVQHLGRPRGRRRRASTTAVRSSWPAST